MAALYWLTFSFGGQPGGVAFLSQVRGAAVDVIAPADPGLGIDAVIRLPPTAWKPWASEGYLSAPHGKVIWVRARIPNRSAAATEGMLADTSYFSDRVEAWIQPESGPLTHAVAGEAVAGGAKPVWARTAAFPVTVPAGGEATVFLRASDRYLAHIQPTWWASREDFHRILLRDSIAECFCYGVLGALVFYNFVFWLRLRFADMGYYVLSAAGSFICSFAVNGGPALLGISLGSPAHEMILAAGFTLGGAAMVQFARAFLGTAAVMPGADRCLRAWGIGLLVAAVGVLAMPAMNSPIWLAVTAPLALLSDSWCFIAAAIAWRRGVLHARFFILAYGVLVLATVPGIVTFMGHGIVPGSALALLAGRTLEMLLLSFAVAERFGQIQRQLISETTQREAIEASYADELELEVKERTRELAESDADKDRMLAVIGHDLRSPLTGLMKVADRGGPEVARETARTSRALLLMIEDLVLWARMRAGTRDIAAHPVSLLLQPAVALHRALALDEGIRLVVEFSEGLSVETDQVLAQTLVRNLLANALKFAKASVVLSARNAADGVRIGVRNDGVAVSEAVIRWLNSNEELPLTATGGLGLRLCREICTALGTRLEVTGQAEGGVEFSFMMPAVLTEEVL